MYFLTLLLLSDADVTEMEPIYSLSSTRVNISIAPSTLVCETRNRKKMHNEFEWPYDLAHESELFLNFIR